MKGEAATLFTNKPMKSKLQAFSPTTTAAPGAGPPPPPPPPRRPVGMPSFYWFWFRSSIRPFFVDFVWPLLLVGNFTLAGYVLYTRMNDPGSSESVAQDAATNSAPNSTAASSQITKQQATVLENQQRELFKWMLEEKRRVKPKDAEEKSRIKEEKAILEHFINATSIPDL